MGARINERLDFRRIGVDTGVLSLEFGGAHRQAHTVALDPYTDPVKGDHALAGELDRDAAKVRMSSWIKHSCAIEARAEIPVVDSGIASRGRQSAKPPCCPRA